MSRQKKKKKRQVLPHLQNIGKGRHSDSPTVRDVGNAVFWILGHLPGGVVQTVRLADTLDAMEVDWMPRLDLIKPLQPQRGVQVFQLLLQDDEEHFIVVFSLKSGGDWKIGEGWDHDGLGFLFLSPSLFQSLC